ncbi:helix-turn-helix transcriptional regulator, partial [Pseudonocardia hydrocarbonoxydans]|uniref:helix-turn-helix transcriptional regulator n=1 Tax=Pseudonocardia hydrocarbonoxydans TaxID=76726 RepID=UPI0031D5C581
DEATRTALALAAARACVAAERFAEAYRYLDQAGDGPAVDALRAHAALGLGDPATAQAAARRASPADDPAVECGALEALRRVLRRPDPAGSRAALTRAVEIAARHGLAPWRIRALAELGAGTMIELGGTAELERAAELAVESGMLGTAVALELQITVGTVAIEGYVAASRRARRCAERAGRLGMASARSFALLFAARGQVFAGSLAEAEALLDEAQTGSAEPHLRLARSGLRARDAWLSGDDARAVEGMAAGVAALRTAPGSNPAPLWGEWALLRTVLDPSDAGPRGELRASDVMVNLLNRAALHYADAVAASAAGDAAAAAVAFARAETVAADQPYYRHLFRAQLLPRAGSPGLPDPAGLLREQLAFLAGRGEDRLTELARRRLRALGLPVPRPARDVEPVPAPLRARGVTGRELQVLRLVGAGLSNPEIAARLHLSPRTVETHVGRLLAKTGAARRAELARHLPT